MPTDLLLFTLFYLLVSFGIIYPPIEFISAGFTIPTIFAKYLGSENEQFIQYHIRRSSLTLFIHSLLPFGYTLGLLLVYGTNQVSLLWNNNDSYLFQLFTTSSFIAPLLALYQIYVWSNNNWRNHPVCRNIQKFCNNNASWISIASDINIEFRRVDKISIQTNSVIKVIATDNWLLKITPYNLLCAHQSDTALIVCSSDTHNISVSTRGEVQYINIEVKSTRSGVRPFYVRLNALDFKDLQDKWTRPIAVLPSVTFHKTLLDRFIEAFKEQIRANDVYQVDQPVENCIGCMTSPSNVKLLRRCISDPSVTDTTCSACYCRPLWCADCLARWFASRQGSTPPDVWMQQRATCPVCRAGFCVWDVCYVRAVEQVDDR